jgi:ribonuclease J
MIELVRPKAFVPIHGTFNHLVRHAELARELGIGQVEIFEDGEPLELLPQGGLVRAEPVRHGRVPVDGTTGVSELVLRDRRALRSGFALAVLVLDSERGELVVPPQVVARGVGDERNFPALWALASEAVQESFELCPYKIRRDPQAVRETASRALRRFLARTIDRRPTSLAVVIQIPLENGGPEPVDDEEI